MLLPDGCHHLATGSNEDSFLGAALKVQRAAWLLSLDDSNGASMGDAANRAQRIPYALGEVYACSDCEHLALMLPSEYRASCKRRKPTSRGRLSFALIMGSAGRSLGTRFQDG